MAEEKDDKIYHPEVIDDTEFPGQSGNDFTPGSKPSSQEDTFSAEKIRDQVLPEKVVASELVGSAINTRSRKILAPFDLTEKGAIRNGRIEWSSTGLMVTDEDGNVTFFIDAATGEVGP